MRLPNPRGLGAHRAINNMLPLRLQLPFHLHLPTRCEWARGGGRELDCARGDRDARTFGALVYLFPRREK